MFALLLNFIVAMWALAASAATGYERHERNIGISSGYGGAFGYDSAPTVASISKYLQSGAAPHIVNSKKKASVAISSGYGGEYGYLPPSKVVKKKLLSRVVIPRAYGGASGYGLSDAAISNGYSFSLPRSTVNFESHSQSDVTVSSGYGGAYGYAPTSSVIDSKDMPSNDIVPGSYGSSPISIGTVNNVMQKVDMPKVMTADKMMLRSQLLLEYLPGYSGYGNRISSYSGYSRTPSYPGYGFAYANGWL